MLAFVSTVFAVSLGFATLFASTAVNGLAVPRSIPHTFTNPVVITSVASPGYRIGTPPGTLSIHSDARPIPIMTVPTDIVALDNARWAIELLLDGHYWMATAGYGAAVTNGSVFTENILVTPAQEFVITPYGSKDIFVIETVDGAGAWTIGQELGEQLTTQPFTAAESQLFHIVPFISTFTP